MNKITFCILLAIAALCVVPSCKKDKTNTVKTTPIDSVIYPDYMVLKPGNYWIYEDYMLDSANGAAHALGTFDSSYVTNDTIINGQTYHSYWDLSEASPGGGYYVSYLRDSLGYTVTNYGGILFSSDDFTTIFYSRQVYNPTAGIIDTVTVNLQMGFKDSSMTVPVGTFVTSTMRQIWYFPPPVYSFGPTREYDHTYARGVGMIKETTKFYTNSPEVYEKRLVRFHLQ